MNMIIQESAVLNSVMNAKKLPSGCVEFIATLQEADRANRNGRVYPKVVLEKALQSAYIRERLETKTFYGEGGHPRDTSVARQMSIDHKNIACIITEFWWEGNLLKAKVETANTSVGRDMAGLIEQGSRVAFSLRAQGNVHKNPMTGLLEVEDGLMIFAYDWVITPSHDRAFMEKLCEDTISCIYNSRKEALTASILCEAEELYENGNIYDPAVKNSFEELNYTKNYTTKYKLISDMYLPDEDDELISMNPQEVVLRNDELGVVKTVLTEDYLVKDFRKRILSLDEAIRLGGMVGNSGNNLMFKYTMNSIKIENLVNDYISYKNISGSKYRPLLRTAAREDKKCQEIHEKMKEELISGKQNKQRMDSLRNAFFAAMDRLYKAEVKADRVENNTSYVLKEDKKLNKTEKRDIATVAGVGLGIGGSILAAGIDTNWGTRSLSRTAFYMSFGGEFFAFLGLLGLPIAAILIGTNAVLKSVDIKERLERITDNPKGWLELYAKELKKEPEVMQLVNKIKSSKSKEDVKKLIKEFKPKFAEIKRRVKLNVKDDNENKLLESFDFIDDDIE